MAKKRDYYGGATTRRHGGHPGNKTAGFHFFANDEKLPILAFRDAVIKAADACLSGRDVDLTFTIGESTNKNARISLTSPIRKKKTNKIL